MEAKVNKKLNEFLGTGIPIWQQHITSIESKLLKDASMKPYPLSETKALLVTCLAGAEMTVIHSLISMVAAYRESRYHLVSCHVLGSLLHATLTGTSGTVYMFSYLPTNSRLFLLEDNRVVTAEPHVTDVDRLMGYNVALQISKHLKQSKTVKPEVKMEVVQDLPGPQLCYVTEGEPEVVRALIHRSHVLVDTFCEYTSLARIEHLSITWRLHCSEAMDFAYHPLLLKLKALLDTTVPLQVTLTVNEPGRKEWYRLISLCVWLQAKGPMRYKRDQSGWTLSFDNLTCTLLTATPLDTLTLQAGSEVYKLDAPWYSPSLLETSKERYLQKHHVDTQIEAIAHLEYACTQPKMAPNLYPFALSYQAYSLFIDFCAALTKAEDKLPLP